MGMWSAVQARSAEITEDYWRLLEITGAWWNLVVTTVSWIMSDIKS